MAQEFSWQQPNAGVPIVSGWGPAPQLHAPDIGGLVHAILSNRLGQQALGEKSGTDVAEIIQKQKDAEDLARYRTALIGEAGGREAQARAMATWIGQDKPLAAGGGRGVGAGVGVDFSEHPIGDIWRDQATGILLHQTRVGPQPFASALQSTDTRAQSQNQLYAEQARLLQQKSNLDVLSEAEKQANIKAGKANVPFSAADAYNQTAQRLSEIQRQLTRPDASQGQGQPDVTPTPIPYGQDIPNNQVPLPAIGASPGSTPAPIAPDSGGKTVMQLRAEANDAIARGADRAAVSQRFHDQTGGVL